MDTLLDIKKELRANMNGVASAAMRQTEDYRLNWGIELPRIHAIAQEFAPDHQLAQALWKESVRECKILATLLMPVEGFDSELCDVWAEDIRTVEIAQIFALNLVKRTPYASQKAFQWIAGEQRTLRIAGYATMCHVLRMGEMSERSAEQLIDHITCDIKNDDRQLQSASMKTLQILASIDKKYAHTYKNLIESLFL